MNDSSTTRQTLILRLADHHDRQAWNQFVDVYGPLIFQFAQRRGLQDSDAADVVQDVLVRVAEAFRRHRYDATRGRFRGWLRTITANRVNDWHAHRSRRERSPGGTAALDHLHQLPAAQADEDQWNEHYEQRLLQWAAGRVREEVQPNTWQAFWQTTMERKSGQVVAADLGMSVAAVYLAKGRIMKQLRELVQSIDFESQPPVE